MVEAGVSPDGLWSPRGKTARWIVLAAMSVNLAASLMMAAVLRQGTAAGGTLPDRLAYVASHATIVSAGWYTWELATLSLVAVFATVLRSLDAPGTSGLRALSFLLLAMGAIPDSINNLINAGILPDIAIEWASLADGDPLRAALAGEFARWDRFTVLLTGALANGLYAAAGWLLMVAAYRTHGFPRPLCHLQWLLWSATTAMSAAALANSTAALIATVAVTMASFVVWSASTAWLWLGREPAGA